MNMSGDIRVRADRAHKRLYNELCECAFPQMHELFYLCTCLGYKHKKRKPLGKSGEDRFWSSTITPEEYISFYSMQLADNEMEMSSVRDDQQVITRMEEYANAGMGILIDSLLRDFTLEYEGELRLDPTSKENLPKLLLSFVFDETLEAV